MVDLKQVLIQTGISAATVLVAITMGFGKHTAQTVYTSDGVNVEQQITALNHKVDGVTGVLIDAINSGTKKVRTEVIDQAKEAYRMDTTRIKEEANTAKRIAEEARRRVRENPGGTLLT